MVEYVQDGLSPDVKVILSGDLTIETADEIKDSLVKAFESAGDVVLSIPDADNVDLTFFQLMISSQRKAAETGKSLTIEGELPESIIRTMDETGFKSSLSWMLH